MNAIVIRNVASPSPREFGIAWETFFLVVSAIATFRANEYGPRRFGELARHASKFLSEASVSDEIVSLIESMAENDKEKISLGILYEEMQYISWKYQEVFEDLDIEVPEAISSMGGQFEDEEVGDASDPNVIKDVKNVVGSVKAILDKLPPWIRKAVDAILEALQLTRGVV